MRFHRKMIREKQQTLGRTKHYRAIATTCYGSNRIDQPSFCFHRHPVSFVIKLIAKIENESVLGESTNGRTDAGALTRTPCVSLRKSGNRVTGGIVRSTINRRQRHEGITALVLHQGTDRRRRPVRTKDLGALAVLGDDLGELPSEILGTRNVDFPLGHSFVPVLLTASVVRILCLSRPGVCDNNCSGDKGRCHIQECLSPVDGVERSRSAVLRRGSSDKGHGLDAHQAEEEGCE
mmetsp:Transcript_27784/g.59405  ORF Transcript_27784/g.59405 Transcript_27784/m.59405 type:complete len:235 (-) Transcript_27784:191-895(-)